MKLGDTHFHAMNLRTDPHCVCPRPPATCRDVQCVSLDVLVCVPGRFSWTFLVCVPGRFYNVQCVSLDIFTGMAWARTDCN